MRRTKSLALREIQLIRHTYRDFTRQLSEQRVAFDSVHGRDFCSAYFMGSADSQGKPGPEQAAVAAALERFGQLLGAMLLEFPAAAGASVNSQSLGRRLAVEFDRWLRNPASMPPWWQNLQTAPSFVAPESAPVPVAPMRLKLMKRTPLVVVAWPARVAPPLIK